ncbi:S-methyl-5'-thioadenosine phosphorylase [Anaerohalosphaera lusitana]|uniref:Purine nucleoside phosphorylase n=1 Tax=Anaerohalosphaera lusitana TaxID=1936003 RepID=A0A1U9NIF5_9BACT|nr:S-methyl-5'-thioadenosine phosphorylase [Anaerohalosphaera lusitana]AQT67722.1 S-methyl-5'-thioadenosine phosphorylase [Anaerohalosphaera lusitana]
MSEQRIGVIGGTGLGDILGEHISDVRFEKVDTPFGAPSGEIMLGSLAGKQIAFINRHGEGHIYGPSDVPFAANIFALKKLGVKSVIASAAVGSLREEIRPGELVLVDQFIDKTFRRRGSFFDGVAAVHAEMAEPCCKMLRDAMLRAAGNLQVRTHAAATYVAMEGPQFSTKAESKMHRAWGGDMIGMTGMPEAKLAREAQMCYSLVALATDYDCWRESVGLTDKHDLLREILGNLEKATENAINLIEAVLKSEEKLIFDDCPCRHSLEMAVMTKQEVIDQAKWEQLGVLFD